MSASDQLEYQVTTLTKLVAGVRPDQMSNPTPCAEWDVHGLVNHFVGGAGMFAAAFNGEDVVIDPDAPMPDLVGDDPLGALNAAIGGFNRAIDQPGAMERIINLPFGAMPGAVVVELLKFDLTVHAWDLAQATGQNYSPPDEVVAHADAVARQMITPEMRGSGTFGGEAATPSDATPIEKLVAFCGRTV